MRIWPAALLALPLAALAVQYYEPGEIQDRLARAYAPQQAVAQIPPASMPEAPALTVPDPETTASVTPAPQAAPAQRPEPFRMESSDTGRQARGTSEECVPDGLKGVVQDIGQRFGEVTIVPNEAPAPAAGAPAADGAMGQRCRTAELKVPGRTEEAAAYLRTRPEVSEVEVRPGDVLQVSARDVPAPARP